MRWLFLLGLCFDGAGAFLIAWPIVSPPPEQREQARPRWGGNPWTPILEARERRHVQVGALSLGVGFVLQATAYLGGFDSDREKAVAAALGVLVLALIAGTRIARRGLPRYTTYEDKPDAIEDQRHVFQIATVDDFRTLIGLHVREKEGHAPREIDAEVAARIQYGRWVCDVPAVRE